MQIRVSGQEVIGVIDLVALVEVDDPLDAVLVPVGFGHDRMRREDEAAGFQHDVVGDQPRRRQVFLEEGGRHGERFARIVEAGLVGGVDGKLARRPNIDAGQVTNCVVKFGVAQTPCQHGPGVAGVALRLVVTQFPNPGDDRGALCRRRPSRRIFGRHLLGVEPFEHLFPLCRILGNRRHTRIAAEVKPGLRLLRAVTRNAIAFNERPHLRRESAFECVGGRRIDRGLSLVVSFHARSDFRRLRVRRSDWRQDVPCAAANEAENDERDGNAACGFSEHRISGMIEGRGQACLRSLSLP